MSSISSSSLSTIGSTQIREPSRRLTHTGNAPRICISEISGSSSRGCRRPRPRTPAITLSPAKSNSSNESSRPIAPSKTSFSRSVATTCLARDISSAISGSPRFEFLKATRCWASASRTFFVSCRTNSACASDRVGNKSMFGCRKRLIY